MKIYPIFVLFALLFVAVAPVLADSNFMVLPPYASGGAYGKGEGQIDTPLSVKTDADDNIYILQQVHIEGARNRSVVTIFDKNLNLVRSFEVLKTSVTDQGWDRAWSSYYYDDTASDFYVTGDGKIYILCGWDVVVMDNQGKFVTQFPVNALMGSIDQSASGEMQFYYPHGIIVTDDGYVVISSGNAVKKHELIFMYPNNGVLLTKLETPVKDMSGIARDTAGDLYVLDAASNNVHTYDKSMTKEADMALNLSGYGGSPASLAFFANGNFSASANGIFVYYPNGTVRYHFADYAINENKNWGRPIATNSTGWLIVVSGMADAGKTPNPILLYKFESGYIQGAGLPISVNMAALAALIVLAMIWLVGAVFILKK